MNSSQSIRSRLKRFGNNVQELRSAATGGTLEAGIGGGESGIFLEKGESGLGESATPRTRIVLLLESLALELCQEVKMMADSYIDREAPAYSIIDDVHKHNLGLLPQSTKRSIRHNVKRAALILSLALELSLQTDNSYDRLLLYNACAAFLDARGGFAYQVLKQLQTATTEISALAKCAITKQWESNRIFVSRLLAKDDVTDDEMIKVLSKGTNITVDTISGFRLPANRSPESPIKSVVTIHDARKEWDIQSSGKKKGKNYELAECWCNFFADIFLDEKELNYALAIVDKTELGRIGSWNIRAYDKIYHKIRKCLPSKMAALANVVNQMHWSVFALQECPSHLDFDKQLRDEISLHSVFSNWKLLSVDLGTERCAFGFDKEEWETINNASDEIIVMHAFNTSSTLKFRRLPSLIFLKHRSKQVIALVSVHLKSVSSKEDASQTRAEIEALGNNLGTYVTEEAKRREISENVAILLVGDFNLSPPPLGSSETGAWKKLIDSGFTMSLSSDIMTNVFEFNASGKSIDDDIVGDEDEEEGQAYDNAWLSPGASSLSVSGDVFDLVTEERRASLCRVEAALECERSGLGDIERQKYVRLIRKGLQKEFFSNFSDHKPITFILSRKEEEEEEGLLSALPVERRLSV